MYFERRVLARYQAEPDKYQIREDGVNGRLTLTDAYARELTARGEWGTEPGEIGYGFRKKVDGTTCIAVVGWDLQKIPKDQLYHWRSERLLAPKFADDDPPFKQFWRMNFEGRWEDADVTIPKMGELLELVNACFPREMALFRRLENPMLHYPQTDNRAAYIQSVAELNKLLAENVDEKGIDWLGKTLGKEPAKKSQGGDKLGTLKQLQSVLPPDIAKTCIEPLLKINRERQRVHAVQTVPREKTNYWQLFDSQLRAACHALQALLCWLEKELGRDARQVKGWRDKIDWLPKIVGPPNPGFKTSTAENCVGRTVERVEFGRQEPHPDVHECEAIILHFTDGSALGIQTGSNAQNLAGRYGLRPPDFHTDIIPWWVGPRPKGAE